jgi:hypothetical protein
MVFTVIVSAALVFTWYAWAKARRQRKSRVLNGTN